MDWTADAIVASSGIVTSLVFAYFPGIKGWFDGLDSTKKPLMNLLVILAVTIARLVIVCKDGLDCYQTNYPLAFGAFIAALLTNMATYNYGVRQFKQKS